MKRTFYEDYAVGDEFITPARTVTEADVTMFAALSGDYNRLHTDAEYAAQGPFGERIAHGLLGLSIVIGLAYRTEIDPDGAVAFLGLIWKFSAQSPSATPSTRSSRSPVCAPRIRPIAASSSRPLSC